MMNLGKVNILLNYIIYKGNSIALDIIILMFTILWPFVDFDPFLHIVL